MSCYESRTTANIMLSTADLRISFLTITIYASPLLADDIYLADNEQTSMREYYNDSLKSFIWGFRKFNSGKHGYFAKNHSATI